MATRASRKETFAPSTVTKHPIRVVPLHPNVRDAAAPTPKLTYTRFSFCKGFLLPARGRTAAVRFDRSAANSLARSGGIPTPALHQEIVGVASVSTPVE